jgi:hypothetical protein
MSGVLFLLVGALTGDAGAVLRSACDTRAPLVATLPAGTPVSLRFSITGDAGTCYKVSATVGGETVSGYAEAARLTNTDTYRASVGAAAIITTPTQTAAPETREKAAGSPEASQVPSSLVQATRLMQQHQPKAALAMLEQKLKTSGRDYDTLVMAGLAARAADEPRTALGYLEESQKSRQDPLVARVLGEVRREVAGDASSDKLFSNRFLLRYEGGALDPETARGMLGALEQEYSRVSAELQCRVDERISTIVQSPEAYRASSDAAEWSGGLFDGHRIRVPLAQGGTVSATMRQTFAHEIVHACLASLGSYPAWLHEGLAQRLSAGPASPATEERVRSLLRTGRMPRLANMSQNWARLSSEHARNAYAQALVAVDKVYELYASTGIGNVLRFPDRIPQVAAAVDARMAE